MSRPRIVRISFRILAGLAMVPVLSACGDYLKGAGNGPLKWSEDVRLADGRTVTLTPYQEFNGPHELGQPRTESDYWLEFKNPDTGEIIRYDGKRLLATVALLMKDGVPELLFTPQFDGLFTYRCPDPPYLIFQYAGAGQWRQVPIDTLRGIRVRPNMTYSASDMRAEIESAGGHLSADRAGNFAINNISGAAIDFGRLGTQSFGTQCSPPFNWLPEKVTGEPATER